MKNLFARKKILKNGKIGKLYEFPNIMELHTSAETVEKWINYGTLDSEMTFYLYLTLNDLMKDLPVVFPKMKNLNDIYIS